MKKCPYCNKEMIVSYSYYAYEYCNNHGNIRVEIDKNGIFMVSSPYHIMIEEYEMLLFKDLYERIATLPVDKYLTPENFEERIKTYLLFQ